MDLSKYSKQIKLLTIIPLLVGVLTFIEIVLPNKSIPSSVISKKESYRLKTDATTYTIQFENINDQFTQEIYESLTEGDLVQLEISPIHNQIITITNLNDQKKFQNETGEKYAIFGFGLVFILCSLAWLKKGELSKKQAIYILFIILISIIMGAKMI